MELIQKSGNISLSGAGVISKAALSQLQLCLTL